MKKIFISLVCLLICMTGFAQSREVREQMIALQKNISQCFTDKDYRKGLQMVDQSIEFYNTLGEQDQQIYEEKLAADYYNQACFYSLLKEKKKALDAFEKAAERGYGQYQHATKDTDLDYIRNEKRFIRVMERVKQSGDFLYVLRQAAPYKTMDHTSFPEFEYASVRGIIQNVKSYFKLDSVAGDGDEISRIIRVLNWAHNTIPHDGSHWPVCEIDALDIYYYSKANNNRGVNCRALAIFLNECYLSLGIPSRFITCMPKSASDGDCHVINAVFSKMLDKWVWMDPSFNAWVTDENGTLLSIQEVRERMIAGKPYFLNEEANWNNKTPQTKEYYLDQYMAKNLYWFQTPARNIFNVETSYRRNDEVYISLIPEGFAYPHWRDTPQTTDPDWFWQKPNIQE